MEVKLLHSNLEIRNFLVTLKLFLNAKCSLSLWSKLTIGDKKFKKPHLKEKSLWIIGKRNFKFEKVHWIQSGVCKFKRIYSLWICSSWHFCSKNAFFWLGLLWPQSHLTTGHLTTDFWPLQDFVTYDHSDIWPRDIWPQVTFDRKWHLTAGHLTASDIWPRDIWPQWHLTAGFWPASKIRKTWQQETFDCGTFDRQWRLTAGHLTAVTFDRGIFDRQPRLEKMPWSNVTSVKIF